MALRLKGSTSGYVEIDAPAVAGDNSITLPTTAGTISIKDASGNTEVGTGVTFGNPGANIFTINNSNGEKLRIAADGTVTLPDAVSMSSNLTVGGNTTLTGAVSMSSNLTVGGNISVSGNLGIDGLLTYEDVTNVDSIGIITARDGLNVVGVATATGADINGNIDVSGNAVISGNTAISDLDLSAISTTTSDTAVDIFVYDTSKDSDGGEWRKRTSHTSWYNETLGTATRGTRREFPAVAVIVATATNVTIYDGDDPDLPMWMVFNNIGSSLSNIGILGRSQDANTCSQMLNGVLFVGNANHFATYIPFISESVTDFIGQYASTTGPLRFNGNIAQRNTGLGKSSITGTPILAAVVNDVAMTVLPNAPIDDATGLPVPTIAVGTDGGVSVIKDDGSVSDLYRSGTDFTNSVQFTDNHSIMLVWGHASDAIRHINHYSYSDWQSDQNDLDLSTGYHELPQFGSSALQSPLRTVATGIDSGVLVNLNGQNRMSAKWDDYGLKIADLNDSDRANGMVCHIKSDSNSGWMHGDIKGAFLSDISTTNVSAGSDELITNGTFDSNSDWNVASGWSISGGVATNNGTGGTNQLSQVVTMTGGSQYVLQYEVTAYTSGTLEAYFNGSWTTIPGTVGTHGVSFTASTSTQQIYFRGASGTSWTGSLDNVSLSLAEEQDRSVNGKGLQVFGTITKSPVAGSGDTAADLVKYGGFSSSNALVQPYNSDMDWGTGDFYYMVWVYHRDHDGLHGIISRQTDGQASGNRFQFQSDNDGRYDFYSGGSPSTQNDLGYAKLNMWSQVAFVRSGNTMSFYQDGISLRSWTDTANYTNVNANLRIGGLSLGSSIADNSYPADGVDFALFRTGGSAPSAEQIKKMYEDEKVLFQENAKCTLYGTSDAVTALAYDEVTEQLHVGTSAGRSDFQGLRRINNTTTAVTTAISAHDSFILEQ